VRCTDSSAGVDDQGDSRITSTHKEIIASVEVASGHTGLCTPALISPAVPIFSSRMGTAPYPLRKEAHVSRSLRRKPIQVEFVGGPLDGRIDDKTKDVPAGGFLPGELITYHTQAGFCWGAIYVADNTRPLSANGAHRYLYQP
jgi:hypothetical protein